MAQDTLKVFGTTYTGVEGFKASDGNSNELTFIRPEGTLTCDEDGPWNVTTVETFVVPTGTQGTPTATKGTVSNHAVSVTPSVTNGAGWITGGTKTGSAVTVSASELVSGSQTISTNDTYDVTTLAQVIVSVAGSGGGGLEYEEGTFVPDADIARPTISFSKTHSTTPLVVMMADVTNTSHTTTYSNYVFTYFDYHRMWGTGIPLNSSALRYATAFYVYRGNSTTNLTSNGTQIQYDSDASYNPTSTGYAKYWANESEFHPYTGSTSRYWRAGRTYKWIAVWKPST